MVQEKEVVATGLVFEDSAIPFESLISQLVAYGRQQVGCDRGYLFMCDGGTGKLQLVNPSFNVERQVAFLPGEGIVGRSFNKREVVCTDSLTILEYRNHHSPHPDSRLRAAIAVPIVALDTTIAVFCFEYVSQEPVDTNFALTPGEAQKNDALFSALESSTIAKRLYLAQGEKIWEDLKKAGEQTACFRYDVNRFLTGLASQFRKAKKPAPELMAYHVVDHARQMTRTVQAFGLPLRFQFTPPHAFDSNDIQIDIALKRQAEVIVGNDNARFHQKVFKDYDLEKYVRLWMPLFPFPHSRVIENAEPLEKGLEHLLSWREETSSAYPMKRVVLQWPENHKPPATLVYGILELGYLRPSMDGLTLAPWNRERILWTMARAYEQSWALYPSTLPGTLEQIGRLLASGAGADPIHFTLILPHKNGHEKREYPLKPPWPAAVPQLEKAEKRSEDMKPVLDHRSSVVSKFGSITVKQFAQLESRADGFKRPIRQSIHSRNVLNASFAVQAFEEALSSYESALNPFDFGLSEQDTETLGTIPEDDTVVSILREAMSKSDAICGGCVFSLETYLPPVWIEDRTVSGELKNYAKKMALEVAQDKLPQYHPADPPDAPFAKPLWFYPLELIDNTVGIIVLIFEKEPESIKEYGFIFQNSAARWIQRLSLRRLFLRNRFSELMMTLRNDIIAARNRAEGEPPNDGYLEIFIQALFKSIIENIRPLSIIMMQYAEPETGPSRLQRYLSSAKDVSDPIDIGDYLFIGSSLHGPCGNACSTKKLVIHSNWSDQPPMKCVMAEIKSKALELKKMGEADRSQRLSGFVDKLSEIGAPSTWMTIPVLESREEKTRNRSAITVLLRGEHWFDIRHRERIMEVGNLIGICLHQMRSLAERQAEDRYTSLLEDLHKKFEEAKDIDQIIDAFNKRLSSGADEKSDRSHEKLAEDIIFWFLNRDHHELVVYSSLGDGLDALKANNVIDPESHPLLAEINIEERDNEDYGRIAGKFRLWRFCLENRSQEMGGKQIANAYIRKTGKKWLLCFPIVDALDRILGVIDLLRSSPLSLEDETVLERVFNRLSRQLCSSIYRCVDQRGRVIAKDLYAQASACLREFQIRDVYREVVNRMKMEFGCTHCDLFLEKNGQMLLHSTTRGNGPSSEKEPSAIVPDSGPTPVDLLSACLSQKREQMSHKKKHGIGPGQMSEAFYAFIRDDFRYERMAFPLKEKIGDEETVVGILHLRGPLKTPPDSGDRTFIDIKLNKSTLFTEKELRLCRHVGPTLQRIVQMVRAVERQGWLTNELVHSLGQPLQVLRFQVSGFLSAWRRKKNVNLPSLLHDINKSFDYVHESRRQLDFFARLSWPDSQHEYLFEMDDYKKIVKACCDFMAAKALQTGGHRIDYRLQSIAPLPMVIGLIRSAIINLLDNAIKYSWRHREIKVKLNETNDGRIKLQVVNWGIGIPDSQHRRIFEPYFRSAVPDDKGKRPGTGVGLTIVKQAVKRVHSGEIDVHSKPIIGVTDERHPSSGENIKNREYETTFSLILFRKQLEGRLQSRPKEDG